MTAPKIIIADDDRNLVKSLTIRLRAEGLQVLATHDAYQALKVARDEQPQVMLLDINMPAGDGFSVQERMRRIDGLAGIPVIYLTGERSARIVRTAKELGAFALVYKPFDIVSLVGTILDAVNGKAKEETQELSWADAWSLGAT
jgi:DNA-binding response OmpR family regulator